MQPPPLFLFLYPLYQQHPSTFLVWLESVTFTSTRERVLPSHLLVISRQAFFSFPLSWFIRLDVWHAPQRHKHMEVLFLEGYRCHLRYWKRSTQQCWGWSCECSLLISTPSPIILAIFLFFLQRGSLKRNNSFERKVRVTVYSTYHDCKWLYWRKRRVQSTGPLIPSFFIIFFYCQPADWGEQPRAFGMAVMIIINFNTCYRWRHRSSSKCHIHCSLMPFCCHYMRYEQSGDRLKRGRKKRLEKKRTLIF